MFTEYVCESPWRDGARRGWATLASFALQAVAASVVLLISIIGTVGVPSLNFPRLVAPIAAPAVMPLQPIPAHAGSRSGTAMPVVPRPIAPSYIPRGIPNVNDVDRPQIPLSGVTIPGAIPGPGGASAITGIVGSTGVMPIPVVPKPAPVQRIAVSHAMEAYLIRRVQPEYPAIAKAARIQGEVILRAVIAKDGSIENLKVLSGHPMLAGAAVDAVRQWRYRPYFLNGEAVEVETQVTVKFVLSGG